MDEETKRMLLRLIIGYTELTGLAEVLERESGVNIITPFQRKLEEEAREFLMNKGLVKEFIATSISYVTESLTKQPVL